jgi:hypothetical protein
MSSLVQIGQVAPQRSLLEMIQQLADQEHQMLIEARQKALHAATSTRRRRDSRSPKVQDKARTRTCA